MSNKKKEQKGNQNLPKSLRIFAVLADRYGIPVATFACGAIAIVHSINNTELKMLPWLGTFLILASLSTYIWQTSRSTIKKQMPPPPIQKELKEILAWMKVELQEEHNFYRSSIKDLLKLKNLPSDSRN